MKLFCPLIFFLICFISGCATVKIEQKNIFPFRAEFGIKGNLRNFGTDLNGAILIISPETGVSQIYGPGGIAVYTLKLENGNARLTDIWDREINGYRVPVKDIAGLLAGLPPSGLRCAKKNENGETELSYFWGDVILDKDILPVKIYIKGEQKISAVFSRTSGGIDLMIAWGTDNFIINIITIEGGRWKDAESKMQDMR